MYNMRMRLLIQRLHVENSEYLFFGREAFLHQGMICADIEIFIIVHIQLYMN